jgi:hypothetical protein
VYQNESDAAWKTVSNQYPNAVRPQVERIKTVTHLEWPEAMTECLQQGGFQAKAIAGGGITSGDIPTAQAEAYAVKQYECSVKFPFNYQYYMPLNTSQMKYLYSYYVDDLAPCLVDHDVDVADAPSWETFAETFGSESAWSPLENLTLAEAQESGIDKACPADPEGLYAK